jgi:hypothetical protein
VSGSLSPDEFRSAYRRLESAFQLQAESDSAVYLPNPRPIGPADFVFVAMEPSLGGWAGGSPDVGRGMVEEGYLNFIYDYEGFLLHHAARHYACGPGQTYHITDISKGAMPVKDAGIARTERYDRWFPLLADELRLVCHEGTTIYAIGSAVADFLKSKGRNPAGELLHYSQVAASFRKRAALERPDDFVRFASSIQHADIVATARKVMDVSGFPARFQDEVLVRLAKAGLTESRKHLLFTYKSTLSEYRTGS